MPTPPARPAVYLPGASGRAAVWRKVATRLRLRREPVLVDYPGLGDAPADPSIASVGDLCRVLAATLPSRADVVSLSMGSAVALRLALAYPERVRRLVLVTPCGGVNATALGAVDWRLSFRNRRPDAPTYLLDDGEDLEGRLGEVAAPTLLVCGELDLVAPVAVGERLRSRLPDAKLEIVAGATHDLEDEQTDLVAALIEAHLRR